MAKKGYSTLPKATELELHNPIYFDVMLRTYIKPHPRGNQSQLRNATGL